MSYMTLSSQEKHLFFTLFILSRTSDNTTSLNIGGTNAWAVPPPQIVLGGPPPSPPRSPPLIASIQCWEDEAVGLGPQVVTGGLDLWEESTQHVARVGN